MTLLTILRPTDAKTTQVAERRIKGAQRGSGQRGSGQRRMKGSKSGSRNRLSSGGSPPQPHTLISQNVSID